MGSGIKSEREKSVDARTRYFDDEVVVSGGKQTESIDSSCASSHTAMNE